MNQAERQASNPKSPARSLWLRVILSFFIVYHLTVIVVLANGSSFLGRTLDPWITAYGNFLGFNMTWNFFAPDPAHTMFIHYNIRFEDSDGKELQEPLDGYIPPEKEKIVIQSSQRRFLYAMRRLILDEKSIKAILGPFLCRDHPGASSVHIEHILEPIANLDQSRIGEMRQKQETTMFESTFHCNEAQDEVAL